MRKKTIKILNVDDSSQNLYMLESLLKGYGYEVILAKNGKEALELAKKNLPELIISDILMPVMDGFEFCRLVKSDDRLKQIPFIFYTATYTDQKDEEFALTLGANRFVIKPQDPEKLMQIVNDVLKNHKQKNFVPPSKPMDEEKKILKKYNEVLFHKLEKKVIDLEAEIAKREKAEKLLKENERKYYSIFENSNVAILLTIPDGKILSANSSACKLFNRSEKELCKLGRNGLVDLSDPRLPGLLEERKRTGSIRGELTFIKKDGTKFEGEISSAIFKDHLGNEFTSMIIRDLTEQKEAQENLIESEKKFRFLFEKSPLGKSMTGIDGTLNVNRSFCNITGYTEEELLSKKWMDITHPDDISKSSEIIQSLLDGRIPQARFEKRYIHKNGNIIWTDVTTYLQRDKKGEPQFFITTISDITESKQIEEELKKNEARLRSYFKLSSAGIAITSLTTNWIEVSDKLCEMLGYSRDELLQTTWTKLTYPDDLDIDLNYFNNVLAGKIDGYSIDKRFIRRDGKIIWTNLSVRCVRFADGKVDYFIALLFDISDRKQAEKALMESEELYRTLVEISPDVIYTITKDGIFTSLNPAFEKITGLTRSEWIGKSHIDLIHPDDIQDNIERFQKVLGGETIYGYEIRIRSKAGIYLIGEFTSGPYIRDGKIVGMHGIARDITERKKAELALIKFNEELENQVKQRTTELIELNKELESFSYSVSHDLKAPLRSINGFSQILSDEYSDKLDDEGRDLFCRIRNSSQLMGRLIDDLLALSKVTRYEIKHQTIDLTKMVNSIINEIKKNNPERKIDIIINQVPEVESDYNMLNIALTNLINNAWKFTGKKPDPKIEFGSKIDNNETIYYIKDNGIGFNMDYVKKIFNPFQRLHTQNEFPGTGIGLAIVKRIFTRLEGSIRVEAEIEKGTTFYFILPDRNEK